MKISQSALPHLRTSVLLGVFVTSVLAFGYMWVGSGGNVTGVTDEPYEFTFVAEDVNNLVQNGDVTIAGTEVGTVRDLEPQDNNVLVSADIEREHAPLHEGATAKIREKTLVGETYVDFTDGDGEALPDGTHIPITDIEPATRIDDVLRTLDQPTRESLSGTVQSLGEGTEGTQDGVSAALQGLGDVSRDGGTALSALAAQTDSLEQISANTTEVLEALDTRQGQIGQLVSDADELTRATSQSADDIEAVMSRLPGVLDTAQDASVSLSELAPALSPVADNLESSAPNLNAALAELPETSQDLRGLLPSLDTTLDKAPPTLARVPSPAAQLQELMPRADEAFDSLNPMLDYMEPYGPDMATFFTNFGQTISRGDANGTMLRVLPVFNEQSVKGYPVETNSIFERQDPFPDPGQQGNQPDRSPLSGGE